MTGQMNNIDSILNTIVIKFGDRAQVFVNGQTNVSILLVSFPTGS